MQFYYSKTLPNAVIYWNGHDLFAIPMTGNRQYGWNARRRVYLALDNLIDIGDLHIQRLVAECQGVPPQFFPTEEIPASDLIHPE